MLIALEGGAGSGKSTLRNHILNRAKAHGLTVTHLGQFSWLSLHATRSLVAVRTARDTVAESEALDAVLDDLSLHLRHNLIPAGRVGDVIADRLLLSTACMLATTYRRGVERYVSDLTACSGIQPDLTILLTTAPELCQRRLAQRLTAHRPIDQPDATVALHELYQRAASAFEHRTGRPVWRRELNVPADTARIADEVLDRLRGHNVGVN